MKVYISLPITGLDLEVQKLVAEQAAERIRAMGDEPVNPFDVPYPPNIGSLTEEQLWAYYMGRDIEQLLLCDAIYFCNGWQKSKGCNIEYLVAVIAQKEMLFEN